MIISRDAYFSEPSESQFIEMKTPLQISYFKNGTDGDDREKNAIDKVSMKLDDENRSESKFEFAENLAPISRGPGTPRILRSGGPGRLIREYNVLGLIYLEDDIQAPETVEEALSGKYGDE